MSISYDCSEQICSRPSAWKRCYFSLMARRPEFPSTEDKTNNITPSLEMWNAAGRRAPKRRHSHIPLSITLYVPVLFCRWMISKNWFSRQLHSELMIIISQRGIRGATNSFRSELSTVRYTKGPPWWMGMGGQQKHRPSESWSQEKHYMELPIMPTLVS